MDTNAGWGDSDGFPFLFWYFIVLIGTNESKKKLNQCVFPPLLCFLGLPQIGSNNVWVYIFTLLGMLIFVVATTHLQGWKLTKTLAFLMLMFYFGFLALAIMLELPFPCT